MNRRALRRSALLLCCAFLTALSTPQVLGEESPKAIPAGEVDRSVIAALSHQGVTKPSVVSHVDLTEAFGTATQWTFVVVQDGGTVFGQTNSLPLVELSTDNWGMYFPAGPTLYATIFANGDVDFMDTSNHDLVIRHAKIRGSDIHKLRKTITKRAFRDLHGEIKASRDKGFHDYEPNLKVVVHYSDHEQSFTLRGFDSKDGRPFPRIVNEFLCQIDDLKKAKYRLSSGCK